MNPPAGEQGLSSSNEDHNDMRSSLQGSNPPRPSNADGQRGGPQRADCARGGLAKRLVIVLGEPVSTDDPALWGRRGAAARRERRLLLARAGEQPDHTSVALVASRLMIKTVRLIRLPAQFELDGPRSRPRRRILDRNGVFERLRVGPGPAFDEVQVLPRSLEVRLRAEIGDVDHERVALPAATRVSPPLPHVRREMRAAGDRDRARPALPLTHIVENRYRSGRLDDPAVAREIRQVPTHAPFAQAEVFRTVGAIEKGELRHVMRSLLCEP